MPSAITHSLCAKNVALKSDGDYLRKIINKKQNAYILGSQGPDPFYYYGNLPWTIRPEKKKVREYGDYIHQNAPTEFFAKLLKIAKESKSESLIAYAAGFLAHHGLDSQCHPYIFYETDSIEGNSTSIHQVFEKQIDVGMLNTLNISAQELKVYQYFRLKTSDLYEVTNGLKKALNETYGLDSSYDEVKNSLIDIYKCEKLIFNPTGKREKVIGTLETLINQKGLGTNMMVPLKYDDKMDALNLRREVWLDPTDKNISHNEDFMTLYATAVNNLTIVFNGFDKYLQDEMELEELLKLITDKSYETGRDDGKEMLYFKRDLESGN